MTEDKSSPVHGSYIQTLEDDVVATLHRRKTWKCQSCGKRSTGFVVPFGRCYLCGGELEVVAGGPVTDDPAAVRLVREAYERELEMATFYELALEQAKTQGLGSVVQEVLEELRLKERDHIEELEGKYGVEPPTELADPDARRLISGRLFEQLVETEPNARILELYDLAITLEKKTRDHFLREAEAAEGRERELYREFAAEEEDHVAMLETERRNFVASREE